MNKISVCEIFKSIQGESTFSGRICSFVRLSHCNLSCSYCDTRYAESETEEKSIEEIIESIKCHNTDLVEITGGEPLIQSATPQLCQAFLDRGYTVLIETNGSKDISVLPAACRRIIDVKCPGSSMEGSFLEGNFSILTNNDELKYVISDRFDFDWALQQVLKMNLHNRTTILFSPNTDRLCAADLASWILQSNAPVRLSLQLHKIIWGNKRGV